jgi:hypothetical protein
MQTLDHSHRGARSSGLAIYFGMEDSGPRWAKTVKGESAPVRGGLPAAIVTMMIMRVLAEELLSQGLMGQKLVLECLSIRCAWVPVATSCHARP